MIFAYIDPGSGYVIAGLGGGLIIFFLAFFGAFLLFFKRIFNFLSRHKMPVFITLAVIVILAIITTGVIMLKNTTKFDKKLIIMGFDALSPEIMEPMMEKGLLPNFSRLKDEGSYKKISTTNPAQSPVAWSGFSTGQNPGKHGIYDFITRDPKTYMLGLSLSEMEKGTPVKVIKSKCFWEYLTEKNVPSVIISCPVTFPPDKIRGRMLSGMGVPDILGTEGTFSFYTTEKSREGKDTGGNVFYVENVPVIESVIYGPRKAVPGGGSENRKILIKITRQQDKKSVIIEFQGNRFELSEAKWSEWKPVSFKLGPFKKMNGILKFYLVEAGPDLKLFAGPINHDPRNPFFPVSHPGSYSKELAEATGLFHTQGMPFNTWAVNEKRLPEEAFLEEANEILGDKKAMLDLEMGRIDKGVLFCYFESPDIIQHMFWRYIDPEHPLYEQDAPTRYKEMIRNWYIKMDGILGEIMKTTGEDDILVALSDHGFTTFRRAAHINSWLRENGYLSLKDTGAPSGGDLLQDIDWSNTRAYSIGFGAIYINQEGREKNGIVSPGQETELLKEEISGKLEQWTDEKYGTPVINRVYEREEIFWGPQSGDTPDLYIGFNKGYRASWQTALGSVPDTLMEDNLKDWSGSHLIDPVLVPGVIFSNRQITKDDPSLYDITPTILKVSGYDEEELREADLDGTPLF